MAEELTVYPDGHPESTSVDGVMGHSANDPWLTWAEIIAGEGVSSYDYLTGEIVIGIQTSSLAPEGKWLNLLRGIFLFDTSSIGSGAVINGAVLSLYGYNKLDDKGVTPDINVYSSAPASNDELVAGDFNSLGDTPFCDTPITYAGWDTAGYNAFILNDDGLNAIVKGGITKLGVRNANYDVAAIEPDWTANLKAFLYCCYAENVNILRRPKLVITYTAGDVATVTTQAMSDIVTTTATGNGNVTDLGDFALTQHGHCWNTTGTPTTSDGKTENGAKATTGAFTSSLTGLTPRTLYYVRAYATNDAGTSYGEQVIFTAGALKGGERAGLYAVVETRFHYVDAYGTERYMEGTAIQ